MQPKDVGLLNLKDIVEDSKIVTYYSTVTVLYVPSRASPALKMRYVRLTLFGGYVPSLSSLTALTETSRSGLTLSYSHTIALLPSIRYWVL